MRGPVVIVGARGGVGCSTLALGLALHAAAHGERPWLIELGGRCPDIPGGLGLAPGRTVSDLAPVAAELTARHLDAAAIQLPSGPRVLAAHGAEQAPPTPDQAVAIARAAAGDAPTFVDAGAGAGAVLRALVPSAAAVMLVTPGSLAGARAARRAIEGLASAGSIPPVLAPRSSRDDDAVGPGPLQNALGIRVLTVLPDAPREARALWAERLSAPGRRRPLAAAIAAAALGIGSARSGAPADGDGHDAR